MPAGEEPPSIQSGFSRGRCLRGGAENDAAFEAGAPEGRSRSPRAPLLSVEPRLQEDRGGGAVDALSSVAIADALLAEACPRFLGREALVDELDLDGSLGLELLGEATRPTRRRALLSAQLSGEPDQEEADPLLGSQLDQGFDGPARVAPVHERAGMCQNTELVRDGHADANLADVEGGRTNHVPAFSTRPRGGRPSPP